MKPNYDEKGNFYSVQDDNGCVPCDPRNSDYQTFLASLSKQGQTLDQWLAANPYDPYAGVSVAQHQTNRLTQLNDALNNAVNSRYDPDRQKQFAQLLGRARYKVTAHPNVLPAITYMEALENWAMFGAQQIYAAKAPLILAAASHAAIDTVTWDAEISAWLALDQNWQVMTAAQLLATGEAS